MVSWWGILVYFCTVYSIAKFHMVNPFVYTTEACDDELINLKYRALLRAACENYTEVDRCPFRARKNCYKRRLSEVRFQPT